ncbi:MAG TPA: S8 family serine peptidase [Thermoanaerobaculia bacterium]|jgi:subtilisin family serine protease
MKRPVVFLLAIFLTTTLHAADTQRYLVATKRPFAAGGLKAFQDSVDTSVELRRVNGFETFRGFAADLTAEEVAALRASKEVRWVEPVVVRRALDLARNLMGQTTPYGFDALSARQAAFGTRKATINVAVIDTGIDYNHPELKAIYAGGYNILRKTSDPKDDHGHGTHVSGTIAAADNDIGVIGVSRDVRLWAVKMLDAGGSGTSEGMIESIDWVVKKAKETGGRWVVNMSLGAPEESAGEREAFAKAEEAGLIVVAAAGNSSLPGFPAPVGFPAAYPGVVAVGAIDNQHRLASFSSQGPEVDFAAPGVDILSTVPVGTNYLAYVKDETSAIEASPLNGSKRGTLNAPWVFCGVGKPEEFPAGMAGKIAVVKRGGDITFANKTRAAKTAGAAAVIVVNTDESTNPWTLFSDAQASSEKWPIVVRLSRADGEKLLASTPGAITLAYDLDDYGELSGTSMAAPHVTAAIALLWGLAPDARPEEIYSALSMTAFDLGTAGPDAQFGAGAINLYMAALRLAPTAFPASPSTGRGIGRRGGRK